MFDSLPPDNSTFNASTLPMPNGAYTPVLWLSGGGAVLPNVYVTAEVYISSISPAQGSIGGGTYVTITGYGVWVQGSVEMS
jgi:hypothetical protein